MKKPGSDTLGIKIPKNTVPHVPEIQGKAKSEKKPTREFRERP